MKELSIEWRHYDKDGATCDRCAATGQSLKEVVAGLSSELDGAGITVTFVETLLPAQLMEQSNLILLNGVPLEEVLGDAGASESDCASCTCLTGTATRCRTVSHDGATYEGIPPELIRKAVQKLTGVRLP